MNSPLDRAQLLSRFEALLDSALTAEAPPAGLDAQILAAVQDIDNTANDRLCDSYALFSALTALTQEIKLQGRAFQSLTDTLAAQSAKAADDLRAVYAERERNLQREAERRARREILNSLIDLRDRLQRGRETVRAADIPPVAPPPVELGFWEKLFGKAPAPAAAPPPRNETLDALVRGYELSLERLDQTLEEFNAREILALHQPFDPKRMNAIDSEPSATVAPGTVLEVYRSGYEWSGEVFRTAQVKVSTPAESTI